MTLAPNNLQYILRQVWVSVIRKQLFLKFKKLVPYSAINLGNSKIFLQLFLLVSWVMVVVIEDFDEVDKILAGFILAVIAFVIALIALLAIIANATLKAPKPVVGCEKL